MLDNFRSMAIFASVVSRGSFSAAARDMNITTSAVSQQVRSLETEMGVVLLHRSTRKLSLTEAGQVFYQSCKAMVEAAERGRSDLYELRDELVGELRLATTPELGANHVVPALSGWLEQNPGLRVNFLADNHFVDLIDERVDVAIRMTSGVADNSLVSRHLTQVNLILVASPAYLETHGPIRTPADLSGHQQIGLTLIKDYQLITMTRNGKSESINVPASMVTNNVFLARSLAVQGHGIIRMLDIDVQPEIKSGLLVPILTGWTLPSFDLHVVTIKRERQPLKVSRCIDALADYFARLHPDRT